MQKANNPGRFEQETLDPVDWEAFRRFAHSVLDERRWITLQHVRERPVWQAMPEQKETTTA